MNIFQETQNIIFAPITAKGGAVVVVRISGKGCLEKFFENIKTNKKIDSIKEKHSHLIKIYYKEKNEYLILDEAIFVYFKDKKSFTGEDTIEISLHGGEFIVEKFLEMLSLIENFRFAKNGEFTRRAFLNGKIDLLKAESINSIIKSENRDQHFLSSSFFSGNISQLYLNLRKSLVNLISSLEVFIDFPEEDIPKEIFSNIENLKKDIENQLIKSKNINNLNKLQTAIKVGFFGSPNCGKSSLLNAVSKRELAIVSNIKGTTRDVLTNEIKIKDEKVILCDTAGIRTAKNTIEQEGVKRSIKILEEVDIKIFLFDCDKFKKFLNDKTSPKIETLELLSNRINNQNENILILMTKFDLIEKNFKVKEEIINFWKNYSKNFKSNLDICFFSISKEEYLINLEEKVYEIIKKIKPKIKESFILNDRHYFTINKIENELKNISINQPIEILTEELRDILFLIQEITGEITNDDILDKIFRDFCIGK